MNSLALSNFIYFQLLDEKFRPDVSFSTGKIKIIDDTLRIEWKHILPTHEYLLNSKIYNEIFTEVVRKFCNQLNKELSKHFQLQFVCPGSEELCLRVVAKDAGNGAIKFLMRSMGLEFMARPKYITNEARRPPTPPPTTAPKGDSQKDEEQHERKSSVSSSSDGLISEEEEYYEDDISWEKPTPPPKTSYKNKNKRSFVSSSSSSSSDDDDPFEPDNGLVAKQPAPSTTASITNKFKRVKLIDRALITKLGDILSRITRGAIVKSELIAQLNEISQVMTHIGIEQNTTNMGGVPDLMTLNSLFAVVRRDHSENSIKELHSALCRFQANLK